MPRWFNGCYAFLFGYFWLPCPLCGKKFGGHECSDGNEVMLSYGEGQCVCPKCGEEEKRINKKNNYFIPRITKTLINIKKYD